MSLTYQSATAYKPRKDTMLAGDDEGDEMCQLVFIPQFDGGYWQCMECDGTYVNRPDEMPCGRDSKVGNGVVNGVTSDQ